MVPELCLEADHRASSRTSGWFQRMKAAIGNCSEIQPAFSGMIEK